MKLSALFGVPRGLARQTMLRCMHTCPACRPCVYGRPCRADAHVHVCQPHSPHPSRLASSTVGTTRARKEQLNRARRRARPHLHGVGLEGMPGGHASPPKWEVGLVTTGPAATTSAFTSSSQLRHLLMKYRDVCGHERRVRVGDDTLGHREPAQCSYAAPEPVTRGGLHGLNRPGGGGSTGWHQ